MIIKGQIARTDSAYDMKHGLCVNSYLVGNNRYVTLIFENGLTQDYSPIEQRESLEDVYFFRNMRDYEFKGSQKLASDHVDGVFKQAFEVFKKNY